MQMAPLVYKVICLNARVIIYVNIYVCLILHVLYIIIMKMGPNIIQFPRIIHVDGLLFARPDNYN